MRKPYKLIVWGSGRLGNLCVWEVAHSNAFELVGVRAYSAQKNGVDIGEMIGIGPLGIPAMTDVGELLKIDCDCIVYTPRDEGDYRTDEEVLMLLAAGKNVVTPLPYQNAPLFREPEFLEKMRAACQKGGSTFHACGVDPDLISNRILLGLTGACTEVKSIKLQENWDCTGSKEMALRQVGYGMAPEAAENVTIIQNIAANFSKALVLTAEHVLGVKYDRIETSHAYIPTPRDIHEPFFLAAGTVARLTHKLECFIEAKGPAPFFTFELNWFFGNTMLPDGIKPNEYYVATIEGRPAVRMALDFKTSNTGTERFYKLGNMDVEPVYVATIAPVLQAIPHVVEAGPGFLESFGPTLHWMNDLRESVNRTPIR